MADEKTPKRGPRIRKPADTMRQKVDKAVATPEKPRRLRSAGSKAKVPFIKAKHGLMQEFYLDLPNNRFWNFMNKRRYWIPKYVRESWAELRQVTWPKRRETWRLTGAVLVFAIVFGLLVAGIDKVLDILFEKLVLK